MHANRCLQPVAMNFFTHLCMCKLAALNLWAADVKASVQFCVCIVFVYIMQSMATGDNKSRTSRKDRRSSVSPAGSDGKPSRRTRDTSRSRSRSRTKRRRDDSPSNRKGRQGDRSPAREQVQGDKKRRDSSRDRSGRRVGKDGSPGPERKDKDRGRRDPNRERGKKRDDSADRNGGGRSSRRRSWSRSPDTRRRGRDDKETDNRNGASRRLGRDHSPSRSPVRTERTAQRNEDTGASSKNDRPAAHHKKRSSKSKRRRKSVGASDSGSDSDADAAEQQLREAALNAAKDRDVAANGTTAGKQDEQPQHEEQYQPHQDMNMQPATATATAADYSMQQTVAEFEHQQTQQVEVLPPPPLIPSAAPIADLKTSNNSAAHVTGRVRRSRWGAIPQGTYVTRLRKSRPSDDTLQVLFYTCLACVQRRSHDTAFGGLPQEICNYSCRRNHP